MFIICVFNLSATSNGYLLALPIPTLLLTGAKHLSMTLTRSKFEQLTEPLLNRTKQPCKDCLKDAGLTQQEVSEVLLVGGMTRMPKVGRVHSLRNGAC